MGDLVRSRGMVLGPERGVVEGAALRCCRPCVETVCRRKKEREKWNDDRKTKDRDDQIKESHGGYFLRVVDC